MTARTCGPVHTKLHLQKATACSLALQAQTAMPALRATTHVHPPPITTTQWPQPLPHMCMQSSSTWTNKRIPVIATPVHACMQASFTRTTQILPVCLIGRFVAKPHAPTPQSRCLPCHACSQAWPSHVVLVQGRDSPNPAGPTAALGLLLQQTGMALLGSTWNRSSKA